MSNLRIHNGNAVASLGAGILSLFYLSAMLSRRLFSNVFRFPPLAFYIIIIIIIYAVHGHNKIINGLS